MTAAQKVEQGRVALLTQQPFLGQLVCYLKPEEKRDLRSKTMATDGVHLYYDPDFVEKCTPAQIRHALRHEIAGHILLRHYARREHRDPARWNKAADHAANLLLVDMDDPRAAYTFQQFIRDLKLLADPQYQGKTAEAVYVALQEQEAQQPEPKSGPGQSPSEGDHDDASSSSGDQGADAEQTCNRCGGNEAPPRVNAKCVARGHDFTTDEFEDKAHGSASAGEPEPDTAAESDTLGGGPASPSGSDDASGPSGQPAGGAHGPHAFDDVLDAPVQDDAGARELEETWRQRILQAAENAKQRGMLPGRFEAIADQFLHPKQDPRDVLLQFLQSIARSDYRACPPNKRYAAHGVFLPGLRSEGGMVPVIVDTSGSMGGEPILRALGWIQEALQTLPALDVVLIQADAAVQDVRVYRGGEHLREGGEALLGGKEFRVRGLGGTDFAPAFERVEKLREEHGWEIAGIVYISDTAGSFPPAAPEVPVVWLTETKNARVPFGEIAEMEA